MEGSDVSSIEGFRKNAHDMVDLICNYYKTIETREVLSKVTPNKIRSQLPAKAPEDGEKYEDVAKDIESIIMPGITHWQHPNFFAYFPTSVSFPSMLGDMLASGLGVQGMMWITSPACTELETHVIDWLAHMLDLPKQFLSPYGGGDKGGGMIQGTASEVVVAAIVAARWRVINRLLPNITNLDTTNTGKEKIDAETNATLDQIWAKFVVYVSDSTHSSVQKGCMVAGIRNLRMVPSDDNMSMNPKQLEEQLKKDEEKGFIPLLVCATLGTTSTGAVDPLDKIGQICKGRVWLHVDGAYAGSFCILPEYRHLLNGIEHADSFSFNPHKCLLTSFDCSAFWVQDRQALVDSLTLTPEFLRNKATEQGTVIDYKDWGVPLGRRFRSLKLWFVLRMYGVKGVHEYLHRLVKFAEDFEAWVQADQRFEVVVPRAFSLVCFRLKGTNEDNKKLLDAAIANKNIYLSHTVIHGKYSIRMALASTMATQEHIKTAWKAIQDTATELGFRAE